MTLATQGPEAQSQLSSSFSSDFEISSEAKQSYFIRLYFASLAKICTTSRLWFYPRGGTLAPHE